MEKICKPVSRPASEQSETHLKGKENPRTGSLGQEFRFAFYSGDRYVLFNGKAYFFKNDDELYCALIESSASDSCEAVEVSLTNRGNLLNLIVPLGWMTFDEALTLSINIHNDEDYREGFSEVSPRTLTKPLLFGSFIERMEDGLSLAIRDELASNTQETLDSEDLFSRFVGECGAETFAAFCKSAEATVAVCRHFFDLHCEEYLAKYRKAA